MVELVDAQAATSLVRFCFRQDDAMFSRHAGGWGGRVGTWQGWVEGRGGREGGVGGREGGRGGVGEGGWERCWWLQVERWRHVEWGGGCL
jgi:hypothetical protein